MSETHPARAQSHPQTPQPAFSAIKSGPSRNPARRVSYAADEPIRERVDPPGLYVSPSTTTSPWARKFILTLDGGGIRGYSSLILLRALMKEIADLEANHYEKPALSSADTERIPRDAIPENVYRAGLYLPCHYFDYIAGTSFGGLIAIMVGMLGMGVDECIDEFKTLRDSIPLTNRSPGNLEFGILRRRRTTWPPKKSNSFYDKFARFAATATTAATAASGNSFLSAAPSTPSSSSTASSEFKKDPFQCQTLAWCTEIETHKPYAFCSYEDHDSPDSVISIPEVAKAITAPFSPSFKPFKLGAAHFVDGSKQVRDPTFEVLKEISSLLDSDDPVMDLVLSLGTDEHHSWMHDILGRRHQAPNGGNGNGNRKSKNKNNKKSGEDDNNNNHDNNSSSSSNRSSSSNNTNKKNKIDPEVDREKGRSYHHYHRFEVPDIHLGFRHKLFLREIEAVTTRWLDEGDNRDQIRRYAETLVRNRRARAATADWETFALGVRYLCFHDGCPHRHAVFETRAEFRDHLVRRHGLRKPWGGVSEEAFEAEMRKGRRIGYAMAG